jgi:hypothetical protein
MFVYLLAVLGMISSEPVQIELRPAEAGLEAAYSLPGDVDGFTFKSGHTEQRRDGWQPQGEGWHFDGDRLSREDGAPFAGFTLSIAPDTNFYDRTYVAVERVGAEGWIIFPNAFGPDTGASTLDVSAFAGEDRVVFLDGTAHATFPLLEPDASGEKQSIAYIGPRSAIDEGAVTLIAGEEIPAWLTDDLSGTLDHAIARLTDRFGSAPRLTPTVTVTHAEEWIGYGFKGGVIDAATIAISMRGRPLVRDNRDTVDRLTNLVVHEVVHLWNGDLFDSSANDTEPWLHEGSAEYLGSRLWQDAGSLKAEATERLAACMRGLGDRPLDGSEEPVHGGVPYDCGFIIMLATDAAIAKAGRGDVFDVWADVFAATAEDGLYSPADFFDAADPRAVPELADVVLLFLKRQEGDRWADLPRRFAAIGVTLDARPADEREGRLLWNQGFAAVLSNLCSGGYGFWTEETRLVIDADRGCPEDWGRRPSFRTVNGADAIDAPYTAYQALRTACETGGEIVLRAEDGGTIGPIDCRAEIPAPGTIYAFETLPELPHP